MSRAKSRAASGFIPKLHNRAKSLSLQSLEINLDAPHPDLDPNAVVAPTD